MVGITWGAEKNPRAQATPQTDAVTTSGVNTGIGMFSHSPGGSKVRPRLGWEGILVMDTGQPHLPLLHGAQATPAGLRSWGFSGIRGHI